MKKDSLNHALNRGFTLIELMIVIVILGVLMGTILPRLTGAQARARDLGRQANLTDISNALQMYYDDNGTYPGTAGSVDCMSPAEGDDAATDVWKALNEYLEGGVPGPPGDQTTTFLGQSCTKGYLYAPLKKNGIAKGGYVLATDVESFRNANVDTEDGDVDFGDGTTVKNVNDAKEDVTEEATAATSTIFILTK